MSYRVNPDGSIECATAQEALNLQRLIRESMSGQRNGNGTQQHQRVRKLTGLGAKFMSLLLEKPQTAHELAERLDTNVSSFPPMYRALKKWAEDSGFDYEQLVTRTANQQGEVL